MNDEGTTSNALKGVIALLLISLVIVTGIMTSDVNESRGNSVLSTKSNAYKIQSGDTLWDIARKHCKGLDPNLIANRIAEENGGIDPLRLEVGRAILLPECEV